MSYACFLISVCVCIDKAPNIYDQASTNIHASSVRYVYTQVPVHKLLFTPTLNPPNIR